MSKSKKTKIDEKTITDLNYWRLKWLEAEKVVDQKIKRQDLRETMKMIDFYLDKHNDLSKKIS